MLLLCSPNVLCASYNLTIHEKDEPTDYFQVIFSLCDRHLKGRERGENEHAKLIMVGDACKDANFFFILAP